MMSRGAGSTPAGFRALPLALHFGGEQQAFPQNENRKVFWLRVTFS